MVSVVNAQKPENEMKNLIAEVVEPRRAAAIERAKAAAAEFVAARLKVLEENGMDLTKTAPRAHGSMSKKEYRLAQAKRGFFEMITRSTAPKYGEPGWSPITEHDIRNGKLPDLRKVDQEAIDKFIEASGRDASLEFDSYIAKLTMKIGGGVTAAALDSGALWSFSHLTITRADGSVERWRTQMILNVSVLGKVFNQWPTRRVK